MIRAEAMIPLVTAFKTSWNTSSPLTPTPQRGESPPEAGMALLSPSSTRKARWHDSRPSVYRYQVDGALNTQNTLPQNNAIRSPHVCDSILCNLTHQSTGNRKAREWVILPKIHRRHHQRRIDECFDRMDRTQHAILGGENDAVGNLHKLPEKREVL